MKILRALILTVLALAPARFVAACSCVTLPGGAKPAAAALLNNTDAVFVGTVIDAGELRLPLNPTHTYVENRLVLLRVSKSWKGISDSHVIIATGMGGGDCGFPFEKGKEYLVFARRADAYIPGQFTTSICMATQPTAKAAGLIDELGQSQFSFDSAAWH